MIDKNESCNLSTSFPYKINSCDCLICCSKCADIERERPGFSFLTEGKKSKGKPEKQAQRLRRVSPCFSYNWHYSFKNNRIFACTSEAIIKTINELF